MRCPRNKQLVSLEICAARKARKAHGCGSCTYPKQVAADKELVKTLVVGRNLAPKPSEKHQPLYIEGLVPHLKIRMSRTVALDLMKKLQAITAR